MVDTIDGKFLKCRNRTIDQIMVGKYKPWILKADETFSYSLMKFSAAHILGLTLNPK